MVKKKEENKIIDANVVTEERTSEIKKDGFKIGMVIVIIAAILFIVRFIFAILILSTALIGVVADAEEEYGNNGYGYYYDDYDDEEDDYDDFGDIFDQFESYLDKHNYENYDSKKNDKEDNKTRKDSDYKDNMDDEKKDVDRFEEFYKNAQEKNNKKK